MLADINPHSIARTNTHGQFVLCNRTRSLLSIKQRVHHSKLDSPMVPAVRSVMDFFEAVQAFQPDAQPLPQLPDDVSTRVMRKVIKGRILPGRVVQVYVTVGDRGTKLIVPLVGVTRRYAPVGQRLEMALSIKRRVGIEKSSVVAQAA